MIAQTESIKQTGLTIAQRKRARLIMQARKQASRDAKRAWDKVKLYRATEARARPAAINARSFQGAVRRARKMDAEIGNLESIAKWNLRWRSLKSATCFWCLQSVPVAKVHVDHIIPLSRGGSHSVGNLCTSCQHCNCTKSAKMPEQWNREISQPSLL